MLSRARVDTAKLLRTGGTQAMVFGEGVSGVSDSMLYTQRTTAAKAAAPPSGSCGQDLDLALAIWEAWLPQPMSEQLMISAINTLRGAKRIWCKVKGPAAAVVATAARIGWRVVSATRMVTDLGTVLDPRLDPPKVVTEQVYKSVERWRWRRVAKKHPRLATSAEGRGAIMAPVWKVLRSKRNDETWNTSLRAALRSAFANRQWTQTRCYTAHFVKHNRCLLCLDDIIKRRLPRLTDEDRAKVEPTEEDIAEAPIGNAFHRIVVCPRVRKNCAITRPNLEKIPARPN